MGLCCDLILARFQVSTVVMVVMGGCGYGGGGGGCGWGGGCGCCLLCWIYYFITLNAKIKPLILYVL